MLFDHLLPRETPTADTVLIPWHECAARALRKTTHNGVAASILIPLGVSLRDGDVLAADTGQSTARVSVPPADVWVIQFTSPAQLAQVALELGNLHVPVETNTAGELIVIPDGPTREVLERYGARFVQQSRIFAPMRVTVLQGVKLAEGFAIKRG